jgi:hypothetical protein
VSDWAKPSVVDPPYLLGAQPAARLTRKLLRSLLSNPTKAGWSGFDQPGGCLKAAALSARLRLPITRIARLYLS